MALKWKFSPQTEWKSECSTSPKSNLTFIFKFCYVYFNIFTSTYLTSLTFFLTDNTEFRQCFKYAKHTSSIIFRWARELQSESFHENRSESQNFRRPQNQICFLFFMAFLHLVQYYHFYVSYVLVLLLTDSAELRQCFKYLEYTSSMIFCWVRGLWSGSFHQKCLYK